MERPTAFTRAGHLHLPSYFLKIKFNIIIETKPGSLKCFFPSRFPTKTLYAPLLSSIYSQAVPYSFFLIWTPE